MSFVRVHIEASDQHVSVSEAVAVSRNLTVVDGPAVDADGNALPPTRANGRPVKPRTTPTGEAEKKKSAGQSGPNEKEG